MIQEIELVTIVTRLRAMAKDRQNDIQTRYFDYAGINIASVIYDRPSGMYALSIGRDRRRFAFDDVNLIAIDVYEAIREFSETF